MDWSETSRAKPRNALLVMVAATGLLLGHPLRFEGKTGSADDACLFFCVFPPDNLNVPQTLLC